jgi:hypothetical protein
MIVDLRSQNNSVYFNGTIPELNVLGVPFTSFRLRLVSRYSNNEINNDTFGELLVSPTIIGTDWFSVIYVTDITSLQNKELNTYYDCYFEGNLDRGSWQTIDKVLCKILNNFDTDKPNTEYISNNEYNEQYIYFNNE